MTMVLCYTQLGGKTTVVSDREGGKSVEKGQKKGGGHAGFEFMQMAHFSYLNSPGFPSR